MSGENYGERMRRTVAYMERVHMRPRYFDYALVPTLGTGVDLPGDYQGVIRTAHVNGQREALIRCDAPDGESRYRWAPIPG